MAVNELSELLSLIGCGPLGSRTPINNGVPSGGVSTLWGGIDLWDHRFGPWLVGVVEMWKDFWSGDGTLSSSGAAHPRRWPDGQLSPRAGSMSPSQSAIS